MSKNKNFNSDVASEKIVTQPKKISVYTFLVAEPQESGYAALLKCKPYKTMVQSIEDWQETVEKLKTKKISH